MKEILLTQGQTSIVDDEDYEWLMQWKWCVIKRACKNGVHFYARRTLRSILMHREIAKRAKLPHSECYDHIDGNGLNNMRVNLRACTRSQNLANQKDRPGYGNTVAHSKFKGVSLHKRRKIKKWTAQIGINGKQHHLGIFENEEDASEAYAAAAKKYYGEFACTSS